MVKPLQTHASQVHEELRDLLKRHSGRVLPPHTCERCGERMTPVSFRFWMDGGDESFDARLPICLSCNPEIRSSAALDA